MSRNRFAGRLYIESALLSQKVAELYPFFKEIALMGEQERVKFAILYTIQEKGILNRDISKMSIDEIIKDIILPVIQRTGQAKFRADVLTNLGMKVGQPSDSVEWNLDE